MTKNVERKKAPLKIALSLSAAFGAALVASPAQAGGTEVDFTCFAAGENGEKVEFQTPFETAHQGTRYMPGTRRNGEFRSFVRRQAREGVYICPSEQLSDFQVAFHEGQQVLYFGADALRGAMHADAIFRKAGQTADTVDALKEKLLSLHPKN